MITKVSDGLDSTTIIRRNSLLRINELQTKQQFIAIWLDFLKSFFRQ